MSQAYKIIRLSFYALVSLVPLTFLTFTSELFEFNKIILVYIFTAIITTSWATVCITEKKLVFKKTLVDLPLLIFLVVNLVSLLLSMDRHISWFGYYSRFNGGFLSILCYSLLYWAFVTFMDKKSTQKTVNCILITSAAVATYGVAQHFGIDAKWWVQDVKNRVFSTLGQPNWLAAYLVALIFIPISTLRSTKKNAWLYWVSTVLLFITLIFTKSRSGLLAFSISYFVYMFLGFINETKDTAKNKIAPGSFTSLKSLLLSPLSLLTIFFLLSTLIIKNPIRDLIFKSTSAPQPAVSGPALETGGTESGEIRKIVWKGALHIWLDTPKNFLIGSGPETFAESYYAKRPIEHNQTSEWELLYNKAHNEFLNYLSTTGLLGLTSYLILLGFMTYQIYVNIKHSSLNIALLAGSISLLVTNFWGFSVVPTQILLFLFPAVAVALQVQSDKDSKVQSKLSLFQILGLCTSIALLLWTLLCISRYWLADLHFAAAQKHYQAFTIREEASDILNSFNEYVQAYKANPNEPAIASDFGIIAAYMSILSAESNATESANLKNLALAVSDQAITISPKHPNYYKTKSRMLLVLAALDETYLTQADAALAEAKKLSPTDPRIPYNRSLIAKYANDPATQIEFLKEAVALRPEFQSALDQAASLSARPKN